MSATKQFEGYTAAKVYYDQLEKKCRNGQYAYITSDNLVGMRSFELPSAVRRHDIQRSRGVINDSTETLAPFDGKVYTSKAKMRAEAKARDLVEIGTENLDRIQSRRREEIVGEQRASVRSDIERSLHLLNNR